MMFKKICSFMLCILTAVSLNACCNQKTNVTAAINKEVTAVPLKVDGKIPDWLEGTYVRNGPVDVAVNGESIPHWFDGLAMLHAFHFQQGQVTYSNKFLRSDPYKEVFDRGNIYFGGFATSKDQSLWDKITSFVKCKRPYIQNANVNVAQFGNEYVALTETPLPVRFDLKNMNTLEVFDYKDSLPKSDIFESAHPQVDENTKQTINYLVKYGLQSYYVVYNLTPSGEREVISEIPVDRPAYMHSFALTTNYVVLVEFPFLINPMDLMFSNKGFISSFQWHPENGTNFIVINRKTGRYKIVNYKQAFFAFHHVNAYESGKEIVLDIVTYPNAQVISDIAQHEDVTPDVAKEKKLDDLSEKIKLTRYTVSLNNNTIKADDLYVAPIEFPRVNPNYNTLEQRYVYVVDPRAALNASDIRTIYKIDTKNKSKQMWSEAGIMPGEAIFIPNPNGKDEDDGIVASIILDNYKKVAFLLLLDGKSFKEIARSYAPFPIPIGLHGQHFK